MAPESQESDMEPVPGAPSDNTTAVAELDELRQQGYGADFSLREGGQVCCPACDTCIAAGDLEVDVFRRLEGASEPDEMSAILAATCPECGARGSLLVAYGPHASEDETELLQHVATPQDDGTAGHV